MSKRRPVGKNHDHRGCVSRAVELCCEQLESRRMLSSWTQLAGVHVPPAPIGSCMLLSDGTVLAHGQNDNATKSWYKLTPDSAGSYSNGTWTTLTSSSLERLFYASNILNDGRVLVLGGEYSGPATAANFTNTGEIYNPVTGNWSGITNFPQSVFGDDPTQVLDNGKVLAGYLNGAQTYLYDPTANSWTATGTKLNSDRSDEETWIKLGDGSILSWDVFSQPRAQKYDQVAGTWSQAGTTSASLTQAGSELGPGFRIPDGRAVQFGASAHNAIYDPATNTWASLLDTPGALGGNDSPGAELPNGHILFAAGDTSTSFNAPTTFFDVDPVNNTFTALTSPTGGTTMNIKPFLTTMLVLPTGQVLLTTNGTNTYLFNPDGGPSDAWRSTVSSIANNNDGTFTLTGSLLNGVSEGANYGDDAEMSSNYPIITLTNSSGGVRYARSFNWNKTGVGADSATSTQFTLPTGIVAGAYKLNVIANGISSKDYLLVVTNATINNISIQVDPSNSAKVQVLNGATSLDSFVAAFAGAFVVGSNAAETTTINHLFANLPIVVNASGGSDTINVNMATAPVTVNGGDGDDIINFSSSAKNLVNIAYSTYISGGNGNDQVNAYDSNNPNAQVFTLTSARFDRPGWGGFFYASDIESLNLTTGLGADYVYVNSTYANQPIFLNSAGGIDEVYVGQNSNGVQSIAADVNVANSPSHTNLHITDFGDTTARNFNIDFNNSSSYGKINNLTASGARVIWTAIDMNSVIVTTGSAADTGLIYSNNVPITLDSSGGIDNLQIGDAAVGGAQYILKPITITNHANASHLTISDAGDTTPRTSTFTSPDSSTGQLSTLAPATITWQDLAVYDVNLVTGNAADNVQLTASVKNMSLDSAGGDDSISIGGVAGVGAQYVSMNIDVRNRHGRSSILVNDAGDATARTTTISYPGFGVLQGLMQGVLNWQAAETSSLSVITGNGNDTVYVLSMAAPLFLSNTAGMETLNIGGSTDGLNGIVNNISIQNAPSFTTMSVNDTGNTAGRTWTFASDGVNGSIAISPTATITYKLADVTPGPVNMGSGVDTVRVTGIDTRALTLNGNNGNDVFTIASTSNTVDPINAALSIDCGLGSDSIIINNSNDTTESGFTVNVSQVTESDMIGVNFAQTESLDLRGGTGTAPIHTFTTTPSGVFLKLVPGASHDVIRVTNNSNLLTIAASAGLDDVSVNDGSSLSGARVAFDQTIKLGALTIKSLGTASATGTNALVAATTLSIATNGKLELNANDLFVSATTKSTIRGYLTSAYNFGGWNGGTGISSATARDNPTGNTTLGLLGGDEFLNNNGAATFDGQTVHNSDVLVKYTYYGDVDFNGAVDSTDYNLIDFGYLTHASGWANGDVDYSGGIDSTDYNLIDFAYVSQSGIL